MEIIERQCSVCGKELEITVYEDRTYEGGHFFDILDEDEYWECDKCYY